MGRRFSLVQQQHESGDDCIVHARWTARPSQPLRKRPLSCRQRNPSRPVGQLLRHLWRALGPGVARGPFLMLPTSIEILEGGRKLRVARMGLGPPVLLLHGYPDNLQIWCELAPRLATSFQVIAVDWPGMGESDRWPGGATPMHVGERIGTLLDHW